MSSDIARQIAIDDEILVRHRPLIWSICRRMIQDAEVARDAAQEVWVEILDNLESFKGASRLSTWIYTIACRVVMNYARKEKIYTTKFLKDHLHGDEITVPYDDQIEKKVWVTQMCNRCFNGILHCLDNESRMLFLLREIVQLSYAEISAISKKDEIIIRQKISRSRRKIKSFLNNECVLFNPDGDCKCRIKNAVEQLNLPQEYRALKKTIQSFHDFLSESDTTATQYAISSRHHHP